jgi:hypothetical protein
VEEQVEKERDREDMEFKRFKERQQRKEAEFQVPSRTGQG